MTKRLTDTGDHMHNGALKKVVCEYLRTRSMEAEDALSAMLYPAVVIHIRSTLGGKGMHEHTKEDMEAWALGLIIEALRKYDGSSGIYGYVLSKVWYDAIEILRHENGYRKKARTFTHPFDVDNEHRYESPTSAREDPFVNRYVDTEQDIRDLESRMLVEEYLSGLPEREAFVVRSIYINGDTRHSVAKKIGVCSSRITQIVKEAFARIRERVKLKGVRDE